MYNKYYKNFSGVFYFGVGGRHCTRRSFEGLGERRTQCIRGWDSDCPEGGWGYGGSALAGIPSLVLEHLTMYRVWGTLMAGLILTQTTNLESPYDKRY